MRVLRSLIEIKEVARGAGRRGTLGLVPTMGALHEGHLSLVRAARACCDTVAVTIFVNPLQFGPGEDFERYPRREEDDVALLASAGADLVILLQREQMYPERFATTVSQPELGADYEGVQRLGHFDGVLTVVAKLFGIVGPCKAFFGQKDFQQTVVVRQLAEDLDMPVEVIVCPIVRDADGLALSSRNAYLDAEQRRRGLGLVTALQAAEALFEGGERSSAALEATLDEELRRALGQAPDYAVVVDPSDLSRPAEARAGCMLLVAGRLGSTRLLDNHRLGSPLGPFATGA